MADTDRRAEIAVIGGTGFYEFFEDATEITVNTPYGHPSDSISLGTIAGRKIAFIPRHGKKHQYPPHMVNYRANLWALKQLGVSRVLGPCAVGSLQPDVHPGTLCSATSLWTGQREGRTRFTMGPRRFT